MKNFYLFREIDISQRSGVGLISQGVLFDNGKVAMAWMTDIKSIEIFDCIDEVLSIHGHSGATKLVWEIE